MNISNLTLLGGISDMSIHKYALPTCDFTLVSWLATSDDARCEILIEGAYFVAQTKQEAVAKACRWILDTKGDAK